MSDMCNIISYISKSNKATTDIDGDDVPSEMRGVQASQEGRLDPFIQTRLFSSYSLSKLLNPLMLSIQIENAVNKSSCVNVSALS